MTNNAQRVVFDRKKENIMNANLVGSYWVLTTWPIWAIALVLYIATMGVIFFLRDRCEGMFYNTSNSAMIGDAALLAIVLMAAEILKQGPELHWILRCWQFHATSFVVGGVAGFIFLLKTLPEELADAYHNFVIVGLLVYLGITLLPVIFVCGLPAEITATAFLIALWVALVSHDAKTKRLDQRKYFDLGCHLKQILAERDAEADAK